MRWHFDRKMGPPRDPRQSQVQGPSHPVQSPAGPTSPGAETPQYRSWSRSRSRRSAAGPIRDAPGGSQQQRVHIPRELLVNPQRVSDGEGRAALRA